MFFASKYCNLTQLNLSPKVNTITKIQTVRILFSIFLSTFRGIWIKFEQRINLFVRLAAACMWRHLHDLTRLYNVITFSSPSVSTFLVNVNVFQQNFCWVFQISAFYVVFYSFLQFLTFKMPIYIFVSTFEIRLRIFLKVYNSI